MTPNQNDPTLQDLLKVIQRRRKILYSVACLCFGVAVLLCVVKTRRYEATGTIELQKSSSDGLGLDSIMEGMAGGGGDAMGANLDLQTQSNILQSHQIALSVIKDLHLEQNADFLPRFNPIGLVLGVFTPKGAEDPANASLDDAPNKRERLLKVFDKNLKVKTVAGTRLIEVDYSNPDPKVARAVVADVLNQLIDFSFQVRFRATTDASKWLEVQLQDLRNQTTDLQARLVAVQKDTDLFGVGGTDPQGKPVIYSPVLDRLQTATAALAQAESSTIVKGAVLEAVKSGNAELISQLSGPTFGAGSSSGISNSLSLIQTLRGQEATQQAQIDQDATKYGSAYPKLIEERASLSRIEKSLQEEIGRVKSRSESDYQIALQTERGIKATYSAAKAEAERLNDKTIEFTILQRETEQSEELYQDLLKRLKEAGVVEGLHSSNLTIVDEPKTPAKPSTPNIPLYLAIGLTLGGFLGLGSVFLVDALDNRIISSEDIESLGLPLLGILPELGQNEVFSRMPMAELPKSIYSEAMRTVRSAILLSRGGLPPKVILVGSSGPAEGKSTVSLNLAIALGQNKRRVLLVETDMRRPVIQNRLNLPPSAGLSYFLSHAEGDFARSLLPGAENVWVLPAGMVPPFPAELLGSERFGEFVKRAKQEFDFVIFDTAPTLPVVDVQLVAPHVDSMILVARSGSTTKPSVQRTFNMLRPHAKNPAAPAIGVVLNAVPVASSAYRDYYGYKQYGYYDQENNLENN